MPLSSVIGSSSIMQPGVCTSSTRPASPYDGQMIYETDTDKTLIWNGSAWYANWNMAWGVAGYTSNATQTVTAGYLVGLNTTFTAVANRYYKISVSTGGYLATGTNIVLLYIEVNGTQRQRIFDSRTWTQQASAFGYFNINGFWVGTLPAGSTTVKLGWNNNTGSATNTATTAEPNQLVIEDIGPA